MLEVFEVNLLWSTGKVVLDQHLMPTMNKNSLIQIGGPEKGQCGMRAEASLDRNRREAPARLSLTSLPPKPQLEQELPISSTSWTPVWAKSLWVLWVTTFLV